MPSFSFSIRYMRFLGEESGIWAWLEVRMSNYRPEDVSIWLEMLGGHGLR